MAGEVGKHIVRICFAGFNSFYIKVPYNPPESLVKRSLMLDVSEPVYEDKAVITVNFK